MKWVLTLLAASACVLSSCNSDKDIYDPNYNPELNITVPEGFDWSTTQKLTVNVEVNDEYNGKYYYAVRVYDKAPAEGVLPVAASGGVTGEMPFSQEVVIPATVSKLYVAQVFKNANASEVVTVKEVAIDGAVINCSFATGSKARSAFSRNDYADYAELVNGAKIEDGKKGALKKYIITEGQTYTLGKNVENVDIVVLGTLQLSKDVTFTRSEIEVKGIIQGEGYSIHFVGKEGKKDDDDDEKECFEFDNEGSIYLKQLTINGLAELENEGYIEVGTLNIEQNSKLENDEEDGEGGCIIANTVIIHTNKKVKLNKRSYLSCEEMNVNTASNETVIEMKTGAWLRVGTFAINGNQKCLIKADGKKVTKSDYVALAQIKKIDASGLTTEEKILVECSDVKQGAVIESLTENASGQITIVGSVCSGSFDDEEVTGTPVCTYALEDVEVDKGDYDMNDIVVAVTSTVYSPSKKTWTIEGQVLAAGATNKLVPYFQYGNMGDNKVYLFEEKGAVYEKFGFSGTPVPVNTEASDGKEAKYIPFSVVLSGVEANPQLDVLNFGMEVEDGKEEISWLADGRGANARAIQITALFKYPKERMRITDAYPEFGTWVTSGKARGMNWYDNPVEECVVTPNLGK